MSNCWKADAQNRPKFFEIWHNLENMMTEKQVPLQANTSCLANQA